MGSRSSPVSFGGVAASSAPTVNATGSPISKQFNDVVSGSTASGASEQHRVTLPGSGQLRIKGINVSSALVVNSTAGDTKIRVSDTDANQAGSPEYIELTLADSESYADEETTGEFSLAAGMPLFFFVQEAFGAHANIQVSVRYETE